MRRLAMLSLLVAVSAVGAEQDLSVGWIARLPRIDYVWNSSNPTVEGWPAVGSTVTWVANVRWLGSAPLGGVPYRWTIDGATVRSGTLDFGPESLMQAELPWTWTFARYEIAFEIDSGSEILETEERNNRVLVHSNALGVGIYVERTFWTSIQPKLKAAGIGATTFEDWMQRQVRRFNEMALHAVFPDSPDGVLDRWRLDAVHLVEDGTLPLVPPLTEARDWGAPPRGYGTLYPNVLDHTVDMQWGFPASTADFYPFATPWILTIGNSLIHEWAHARSMIDTYAWNLTGADDIINLSPAPPAGPGQTYYRSHEQGLMQFDWGHIDRYTAAAMNRMAGRRAVLGNYNEPWDLGWFLDELPAQNRIRLVRRDGTPIANRRVYLHRPSGAPVADWTNGQAYGLTYDDQPDMTLTSDSQGRILVGRNPFSQGDIFALVEKANGLAILEIEDGSTRRWAYLESLHFNLAYWRGETELADYEVIADAPRCADRLGPSRVEPLPEALVVTRDVHFRFDAVPGDSYELWYAANGGAPVKVAVPPMTSGNAAEVTLSPPEGRIVWWFVETTSSAPCPRQHSSIYAFDHTVAPVQKRRSVR